MHMTPNSSFVLPWVKYLISLSTSILLCKRVMVLPPSLDIVENVWGQFYIKI